MSERNVGLQRRAVDAFNASDIEAFISYADPSIEFHAELPGAVGAAAHHGHDGLRQWHRDTERVWGDELWIEPDVYFDLGENTLLFGDLHGRGHSSGVEVAMPYAAVTKWRDGLCVYYRSFARRQDALSHLGVSEDELEPIDP